MTVDEAREGGLRAVDKRCSVTEGGLIGRCTVGRGSVSVFADADFIMMEGEDADRRLDLMMSELKRSELR
jgi:hypothetical protein